MAPRTQGELARYSYDLTRAALCLIHDYALPDNNLLTNNRWRADAINCRHSLNSTEPARLRDRTLAVPHITLCLLSRSTQVSAPRAVR